MTWNEIDKFLLSWNLYSSRKRQAIKRLDFEVIFCLDQNSHYSIFSPEEDKGMWLGFAVRYESFL